MTFTHTHPLSYIQKLQFDKMTETISLQNDIIMGNYMAATVSFQTKYEDKHNITYNLYFMFITFYCIQYILDLCVWTADWLKANIPTLDMIFRHVVIINNILSGQ